MGGRILTRFAVNIGFLFTELPYLERFAAVRRAGFDAVEFAWPAAAWDELHTAVADAGVRVAQFNMAAGDLAAGERGWASHPDAIGRWRDAFADALELAELLRCDRINVLAGNAPPGVPRPELEECLTANLGWALPRAAEHDRVLLLEVLNPTDTPAYLFTDTAKAVELLERIDDPALRLQFDTYQVAMGGENASQRVRQVASFLGHVQVADAPGRHEPGTGSIDFAAFFTALADIRYAGTVGLEYVPVAGTEAGLGWLPPAARPGVDYGSAGRTTTPSFGPSLNGSS